jgi:DNA-nicking Smr family endonuclease
MGVLTYEVDLHGYTVTQAKQKLEQLLRTLPNQYGQITVIHGYKAGNQLQVMVRKSLKSSRIRQKVLSLNPGETVLLLYDK